MGAPAISIEGLWKEYVLGGAGSRHDTLYDSLSSTLRAPFRRFRQLAGTSDDERFWALRELDVEVQPGEVLGVVGRNGAGKSTLLKILSRITAPTRGRVTLKGRLASLLEVGTGFHPELSGRENIYLNATILGMGRAEIARKFDDIVAFSGVEKFLDTPVKRYSSGMYVRLAFAVAAHVEADILLVDEVLAVGDAEFQKRCMGMMGDVARGGRTILFVSHSLTALRNLCHTGLLLEQGRMRAYGPIGDVLAQYQSTRGASGANVIELPAKPGKAAAIERIEVGHDRPGPWSVSEPFAIRIRVRVFEAGSEISPFVHLHDQNQARVFSHGSFFEEGLRGRRLEAGTHEFECRVPGHLLNDGEYSLDVMLVQQRSEVIQTESAILAFRIQDEPLGIEGWHWPAVGVTRPNLEWNLQRIE